MVAGLSSIFDLDTSLTVAGSSAYANYRQMAPHRDVTGPKNFSSGPINFRFQTGSSVYIVPNRSYIRMRLKLGLTFEGNVQPFKFLDGVAPNINLGHHMFQNCEWRIGDKTVSRISDFVPQVGALHQRLNTSKNWRETTGRATNFSNYSFIERKSDLSSDAQYFTGDHITSHLYSAMSQDTIDVFEPLTNFIVTFPADANGLQQNGTITFNVADITGLTRAFQLNVINAFKRRNGQIMTFGKRPDAVREYIIVGEPNITAIPANGQPYMILTVKRPPSAVFLDTANGQYLQEVTATGVGGHISFREYKKPDARSAGSFEICFQLPLSIWDHEKGIPGADHTLQLNPVPQDVLSRVLLQSVGQDVPSANIFFEVQSMYLVTYQITGPPVTNTEFLIDLETIRLQTDNSIGTGGTNLTQKIFDVSPSTYALAVAYQDQRVGGADTRLSSAQFRFFNTDLTFDATNSLNRFYIQYAGQQFPSPDADPALQITTATDSVGNEDFQTERYMQTMIESGQYYQLAESIQEFRERGPFYYFLVPRDNTDKSTRVQINQMFGDKENSAALIQALGNVKLCLFDLARQVAVITIQGGNVTKVSLQDQ